MHRTVPAIALALASSVLFAPSAAAEPATPEAAATHAAPIAVTARVAPARTLALAGGGMRAPGALGPVPAAGTPQAPRPMQAGTLQAPAPSGPWLDTGNGVFAGRRVRIAGAVAAADARSRVRIERRDRRAGWVRVATAITGPDGRFVTRWRTRRTGRIPLRAFVEHPSLSSASADEPVATTVLNVYRRARATWYGPGSYGSTTACGQTLRRRTIGVAHRTLPCGTRVALFYRGRTIVVPVIDRGPFANGADWDLTTATARALHVTSTVPIGAVVVRRP